MPIHGVTRRTTPAAGSWVAATSYSYASFTCGTPSMSMAREKEEAGRPQAARRGSPPIWRWSRRCLATPAGLRRRSLLHGLLLPGERKSIEPMAARIEPGRVQAKHQSLHHVVAKADWDDAALLAGGARAGAARDRAARAGALLDRGRHRLPQEGQALGRRGAAVLRRTRQAGQLPGGGEPVGGQRPGQPAGRLAALPARGLGGGSEPRAKAGVPERSASRPSRRSRSGRSRRRWRTACPARRRVGRCRLRR